jgi:dUTPase
MKVYLKKTNPAAVLPKQATLFAGGWDVTATEIIQEAPDFVVVKFGIAMQPPVGYKIMVTPRSSLTKTKWVMQNSPGLGDPDFTGEYRINFRALPEDVEIETTPAPENQPRDGVHMGVSWKWKLKYPEFPYKVGERVGQIYLERVTPIEFEIVDELVTISDRNPEGYGSTGK